MGIAWALHGQGGSLAKAKYRIESDAVAEIGCTLRELVVMHTNEAEEKQGHAQQ